MFIARLPGSPAIKESVILRLRTEKDCRCERSEAILGATAGLSSSAFFPPNPTVFLALHVDRLSLRVWKRRQTGRQLMLWTECLIRVAGVCLLLLALTVSGCSTIAGGILQSIVTSNERKEINSFCEKRCSELKGNDYRKCRDACVYEEEKRRSEKKAQEEADRK